MNRKFAVIKKDDKDKEIVDDIKKLMLDPKVSLILNLHDGHGFYRPIPKNDLFNPKAWGQALIIDQQALAGTKYGNLAEIASKVTKNNNIVLQEDVHEFNVKDTQTKDKDEAMRQSLTYFAIQNKKPAMAVETSKNISDLPTKVLYQLKSLEEFMQLMNIKYKRDFELNLKNVTALLKEYGELEIPPHKIKLPLSDLKPSIEHFPIGAKGLVYKSQNPLVAVIKSKSGYDIYNGNIKVSSLSTQSYAFDDSLKEVEAVSDGKIQKVAIGSYLNVKNSFKINVPNDYRLNIIGFSKKGVENESGIEVTKSELDKNYSLDKSAKIYRAEIYKSKSFCGMVVVKFD
jgi:TATA-box binding protein (TBP) (component of TFIID and TFIIIB)